MQDGIGFSPSVEADVDGDKHFAQGGEEAVVRGHASGQFPNPLDGSQLRTVWRQEQQSQDSAVFLQHGCQQNGVVVSGVVERDHHALAARAMAQQFLQKCLERQCIELLAHGTHELAAGETDRAKASHRFAGRGMEQHRILDLRWHPHTTPRAVLLEVAFVQTPQFKVPALGQTAQFF